MVQLKNFCIQIYFRHNLHDFPEISLLCATSFCIPSLQNVSACVRAFNKMHLINCLRSWHHNDATRINSLWISYRYKMASFIYSSTSAMRRISLAYCKHVCMQRKYDILFSRTVVTFLVLSLINQSCGIVGRVVDATAISHFIRHIASSAVNSLCGHDTAAPTLLIATSFVTASADFPWWLDEKRIYKIKTERNTLKITDVKPKSNARVVVFFWILFCYICSTSFYSETTYLVNMLIT